MKYQSEIIAEIVDKRGHEKSSLHYESECIQTWIDENEGSYPKLCDYQSEWLNYINENPIGVFPYETLTDITEATVNHVVPYSYKSAILSGNTGYRDIDTGDILETFEEGRNLELVSVRMPVLTTVGKNLCDGVREFNGTNDVYGTNFIKVEEGKKYGLYQEDKNFLRIDGYNNNKEFVTSITGGNVGLITIPSGVKYIKWKYPLYGEPYNENSKIMIALSDRKLTLSDYEPHKTNILTVNEDVTLRGVGDVQDELNCLTGELTERIGEIVLDGSQELINFYNHSAFSGASGYSVQCKLIDISSYNNYNLPCDKLICDKLKNLSHSVMDRTVQYGITLTQLNSINLLMIKLPYDYSPNPSLATFKEYLSQNPITVQYQLKTESVKTVELTVVNQDGESLNKIKPIEGTMHISTDGTPLKPSFSGEIPVEAITQNLSSFIEE